MMEKRTVTLKDGERIDDLQAEGYRIIQHRERFRFPATFPKKVLRVLYFHISATPVAIRTTAPATIHHMFSF